MDIEIVFEAPASKAIGGRSQYDSGVHRTVSVRHGTAPRRMAKHQRDSLATWEAERERRGYALQRILTRATTKNADRTQSAARQWLEQSASAAYRAGHQAAGADAGPLTPSDARWLDRQFVPAEWKFLRRFVRAVLGGTLSDAMIQHRVRMYARTLDAAYFAALVSAFPEEGTTVTWSLGHAEHCPDCTKLSGTYSPRDLPTTPRAGNTRCLSNCRCTLTVQHVPTRVGVRVLSGGATESEPIVLYQAPGIRYDAVWEAESVVGRAIFTLVHPIDS